MSLWPRLEHGAVLKPWGLSEPLGHLPTPQTKMPPWALWASCSQPSAGQLQPATGRPAAASHRPITCSQSPGDHLQPAGGWLASQAHGSHMGRPWGAIGAYGAPMGPMWLSSGIAFFGYVSIFGYVWIGLDTHEFRYVWIRLDASIQNIYLLISRDFTCFRGA